MTPRSLIYETAGRFRSAGIPDPEVDSALLLSRLCGRPPLELRLDQETVLPDKIVSAFRGLAERRLTREPLQFILEESPFCGYLFYVDRRVLIPRPETELLCEWALEYLSGMPSANVLDLCCGSGCLGITLKLKCPSASVVLSDISADALDVSGQNGRRLGADVRLVRGDLFSALPDSRFDLIVSNPPYIPTDECCTLQPEVLAEPVQALDGGKDGLDFYRRICRDARDHLLPGGMLLMELGEKQADRVKELMAVSGFTDISVRSDYCSVERMVGGRLS